LNICKPRAAAAWPSEGLGKLDTAAVDAFLRSRRRSARVGREDLGGQQDRAATKEGDKADGAKKEKLLAERQSQCGAWLRE
jgi:hypothetical protein